MLMQLILGNAVQYRMLRCYTWSPGSHQSSVKRVLVARFMSWGWWQGFGPMVAVEDFWWRDGWGRWAQIWPNFSLLLRSRECPCIHDYHGWADGKRTLKSILLAMIAHTAMCWYWHLEWYCSCDGNVMFKMHLQGTCYLLVTLDTQS